MLFKWRGNRSMTLSLHAASDPKALLLFGTTSTITALFIYPFFWGWFMPTLHLPALFAWCISIAGVCQLLIGWIPDKPGSLGHAHNILAFVAGSMIIPITIMGGLSPVVSSVLKYASFAYLAFSCTFIILYFTVRSIRKHSLIYQMIFYWGFFAIILSAAYLR